MFTVLIHLYPFSGFYLLMKHSSGISPGCPHLSPARIISPEHESVRSGPVWITTKSLNELTRGSFNGDLVVGDLVVLHTSHFDSSSHFDLGLSGSRE
jgi:hypothetical protein